MKKFWAKYYSYLLLVVTLVFCAIGIRMVFATSPEDIPPPKENYNDVTLCVEPVEIMRKKHFDFILDHRDKTVVEGIRTKQYSLTGCIDCHITPNTKGEYARYSEETHFCASCHQFTAVNIDCFQCHADRPEEAIHKAMSTNTSLINTMHKNHKTMQFSDVQNH